eukprot:Selendium_serpulae@DN11312_c0_g1_i1.p2
MSAIGAGRPPPRGGSRGYDAMSIPTSPPPPPQMGGPGPGRADPGGAAVPFQGYPVRHFPHERYNWNHPGMREQQIQQQRIKPYKAPIHIYTTPKGLKIKEKADVKGCTSDEFSLLYGIMCDILDDIRGKKK